MPIYHQGRKVKEVYHQGRKVKEIWHMGRKIYTSKPVEVMPDTSGTYDARDWLRATLTKYGLSYQTVTELPFDIDARSATIMSYMFNSCAALTTIPQMNTSNVTTMNRMFSYCPSLVSVPTLDTRNVTDFRYMFWRCSKLTDGNATLTVKRKGADTTSMLDGSGLTREPFLTIE